MHRQVYANVLMKENILDDDYTDLSALAREEWLNLFDGCPVCKRKLPDDVMQHETDMFRGKTHLGDIHRCNQDTDKDGNNIDQNKRYFLVLHYGNGSDLRFEQRTLKVVIDDHELIFRIPENESNVRKLNSMQA